MFTLPTATEVLAHAAHSFAADPDEETALLAREVLRLLDTDAKLQRVRELVRAYRDRPNAARARQSLAELEACLTSTAVAASSAPLQSCVQELVAATHQVARLAIRTAAASPQREMRTECMRLAMRCETDASRLRHQLLWQDPVSP